MVFHEGFLGPKLLVSMKFCLVSSRLGPKSFTSHEYCSYLYKPMMIVNDDSRVLNMLEVSLTDDTRVTIYNRHMFIVPAIEHFKILFLIQPLQIKFNTRIN